MRNIAANALTIMIVCGLVFLAGLGVARHQLTADGPSSEPVRVTVERGARLDAVAEKLSESGAIGQPILFRLAARYSGKADELKYGEYEIPAGASIDQILDLLSKGGNIRYRVTVPEGMTVSMAVERLMAEERLSGDVTDIPLEGSLFPDSWDFQTGDDRATLIRRMQEKMETELDAAWADRDPNLPLRSKEELLILASIVEKETRPNEHKKVASVFINRLRRGMKLQTDPTVIYGITLGQRPLGRGLRRSELNAKTPYNTYVIEGLPPTPIANPGRDSIRAVANPDTTDYLFFVADGTGGHAFARTLPEHQKNVAKWREIERQRKAKE
ncbi:MAG: endolytic transglycosylase MltG [Pseudomonadota bacterium]